MTGKKNPSWRGGSSLRHRYYGPNWKKNRRKILQANKNTCQECGQLRSKSKKSLDVHHIVPWRFFEIRPGVVDYEKANDLSNLACYCDKCHRKIENETDQFISLIGESKFKSIFNISSSIPHIKNNPAL